MGITMRHVVWTSAALGLGAFIYVVTLAPMDEDVHPRAAALNRKPPVSTQISHIRLAMIDGRVDALHEKSTSLTKDHPNLTVSWFYRALVEHLYGRAQDSELYWEELILVRNSEDFQPADPNERYRLAWALVGDDQVERGRELFGTLADELVEQLPILSPARQAGHHYNIACYRSMAGDHERALEHWARSVELGVGSQLERGWWRVDPDLMPLHGDELFWQIGEVLEQKLREQELEEQGEGQSLSGDDG